METSGKPSGFNTSVIVWILCAALLVKLSVVDRSAWELGKSLLLQFPHWSATFPDAFAVYSLMLLIVLAGLKVYVGLLARDARKRAFLLVREAFGVS